MLAFFGIPIRKRFYSNTDQICPKDMIRNELNQIKILESKQTPWNKGVGGNHIKRREEDGF